LVTAFIRQEDKTTSYPYYLPALIGVSSIFWGLIWYAGLRLIMRWRGQELKVTRRPCIVQDGENGEWVMRYEIIQHVWRAKVNSNDSESDDEEDEEVQVHVNNKENLGNYTDHVY
jgi:hypothetical protein